MTASVTCIVLNWNGRRFIESCLSSLLAVDYLDKEVVVVDNASTDGSVEFVERQFPTIGVIKNKMNLGFAAGVNVALKQLKSDYAVLVNPDVTVPPDWLSNLILPPESDSSIGIVGCKTYYPGGSRLQHAGGIVYTPRAIPGHIGSGEEDGGQYDRLAEVDYVTGAAMAIRREVLEEIGLFDEGYFLYFEEADFCFRARRRGYRVVVSPQAKATHEESAVSRKGSRFFHRQLHTSRWRFLLKHYPFDKILEETIPAETSWLAEIDPGIRLIIAGAYRKTLVGLPEILARREQDTGERVPKELREEVLQELSDMRRAALIQNRPRDADLKRLSDLGRLEEKPFTSRLPLVNSLAAWGRELWSRIAVKPYVRPLIEQQSDINDQELNRFSEAVANSGRRQEKLIQVTGEIATLTAQLRELNHKLTALEDRIGSAEKDIQEKDGRQD